MDKELREEELFELPDEGFKVGDVVEFSDKFGYSRGIILEQIEDDYFLVQTEEGDYYEVREDEIA